MSKAENKLFTILNNKQDFDEFKRIDDDFKYLRLKFEKNGIESHYGEEDFCLDAFFPYNKELPFGVDFEKYEEKFYGDKFDSLPIILSFFELD